MARKILGLKLQDNKIADHINGNKLDNRRSNLRIVNHRQNSINRKKHANSSSKFKGVCWNKASQKWQAYCERTYLGLFNTEIEAAKAYKYRADKVFGEFQRGVS